MNYDATLLSYFFHAGLVVKCVILILIGTSIFSWAFIFQRRAYLKQAKRNAQDFERAFWSGEELSQLYTHDSEPPVGLPAIFNAGFREFLRLRKQAQITPPVLIENTQRAMRASQMREQDKLEVTLPFLAIVGSTSPYVGLFGTVWGIMQAFRALANVDQATVAMVAPGIAEALIATALGLFAAIPAAIAYNRFISEIGRLMNRFDAFQEEFTNLLIRQTHLSSHHADTAASS